MPYHHKNIVLTLEFLRANGIGFQTVSQRPRTIIYVREGILHQVLSTDLNLAEAVNVGGPGWNHLAHTFVPCGCDSKQYAAEAIPPNPASYETWTRHAARMRECPQPGCSHTAPSVALARQHTRVYGRGRGAIGVLFSCRLCPSVFVSEGYLLRHLREKHPDGASQDQLRLCPGYHRLYTSNNLARHKRRCEAMASGPAP